MIPLSSVDEVVHTNFNYHHTPDETGGTDDPSHQHHHQQQQGGRRPEEYRKLVLGLRRGQLEEHIQQLQETSNITHSADSANGVGKLDNNEMILLKSLLDSGEAFIGRHTFHLTYDDYTAEELLRRLLPVKELPSAFEIIGHLAHINLRDDLLPYKYYIGKVLLDKNTPRIRTIVNKLGSIETQYRTFGMEVIAGNAEGGWSTVTVKEEGCQYQLDFQKVYWNSRLGGEHRRLVNVIRNDAAMKSATAAAVDDVKRKTSNERDQQRGVLVVADLMAGIGPFAIPLTANNNKHDITTTSARTIHAYANDLNPSSYEYLVINGRKNKCEHLKTYNQDARAFCHYLQDRGIYPDHFIMNLPGSALEFLDAFRGYNRIAEDGPTSSVAPPQSPLPTSPQIHVHCFASKNMTEAEEEIWQRCERALGCPLDKTRDEVSIHLVRDVAPNKNMYCVTFRLPRAVQQLPRITLTSTSPPSISSSFDDEGKEQSSISSECGAANKRAKLE